jgi:hypothetical protein
LYLREVKRSTWSALQRGGDAEIAAAAEQLTARGPLVSVFDCASCSDAELVAIALVAKRKSRDFDYIAISREDLGAIGVAPIATNGGTPLPDANQLHRDVDLGGDRAQKLVARLKARGTRAEKIREHQLRSSAQKLRDAGQPVPGDSWLFR